MNSYLKLMISTRTAGLCHFHRTDSTTESIEKSNYRFEIEYRSMKMQSVTLNQCKHGINVEKGKINNFALTFGKAVDFPNHEKFVSLWGATFDIIAEGPPWTLALTPFGSVFAEWRKSQRIWLRAECVTEWPPQQNVSTRWIHRPIDEKPLKSLRWIPFSFVPFIYPWNRSQSTFTTADTAKIETANFTFRYKNYLTENQMDLNFNYNIIFQLSFCSEHMLSVS